MKKIRLLTPIKTILLLSTLLSCFSSSIQSQNQCLLYSELTSHLRGNESVNLSVGINSGKLVHSIGVDWIYDIRHSERALQKSKISYGLNYKLNAKRLFCYGTKIIYIPPIHRSQY